MTYSDLESLIDKTRSQRWTQTNSVIALDERWLRVTRDAVRLADGTELDDYYLWQKPAAVLIVPRTNRGNFVLTCQYKYGIDGVVVEFPGGQIEAGESPVDAAIRELREETGYGASAKDFRPLLTLVNDPTKETGSLFVFIAEGVRKASAQQLDVSEVITPIEVTGRQVQQLVADGHMCTSSSVAAALMCVDNIAAADRA